VGHAITVADPLRVKEIRRDNGFVGYATSGTPADCVKLGTSTLMDRKPDLVVSGINAGANLGINVLYSGTVSGATEGAILGVPSFAISLASFESSDYSYAAEYAASLAARLPSMKLPRGTLLNVNIPAIARDRIKGERYTFQSRIAWIDHYEKRMDPASRTYYWLTGVYDKMQSEDGSDARAIDDGYISITPLHCDITDWKLLGKLGG
jgi:5'-nucleotidase